MQKNAKVFVFNIEADGHLTVANTYPEPNPLAGQTYDQVVAMGWNLITVSYERQSGQYYAVMQGKP